MGHMSQLPAPIDRIRIPTKFSPSQLAYGEECWLQIAVSAAAQTTPRLPNHPAAERGTVFHKLLESAASGAIPSANDGAASVREYLRQLLESAERRLSSDPTTRHFARLSETMPLVEWHNTAQRFIDIARRLVVDSYPQQSERRTATGFTPTSFSDLRSTGRWFEVAIDVPGLRLKGRIDAIERRSHNVTIVRDYKTGKILDRDGAIKRTIELQLRLYALCISELDPSASIELIASNGCEDLHINCDRAAIEDTKRWLFTILDKLPSGELMDAEKLGVPGKVCSYCPLRHACPAYRNVAPKYWRDGSGDEALPFDIWGQVLRIDAEHGLITVELLDAANRRVKIQRLDERHVALADARAGDELAFFGLSAKQSLARGQFHHPRNFFELPSDASQRRAWSLTVFKMN
jgi:hypothetical protein